jgi:hypothetical protein
LAAPAEHQPAVAAMPLQRTMAFERAKRAPHGARSITGNGGRPPGGDGIHDQGAMLVATIEPPGSSRQFGLELPTDHFRKPT